MWIRLDEEKNWVWVRISRPPRHDLNHVSVMLKEMRHFGGVFSHMGALMGALMGATAVAYVGCGLPG